MKSKIMELLNKIDFSAFIGKISETIKGFFVSNIIEQIKEQRKIYTAVYKKINKIQKDRSLIYDKEYYNSLFEIGSELELIASIKTIDEFKNYFSFISKEYNNFRKFCEENDPYENVDNYEIITDEETGEEHEWNHISQIEIDNFDKKVVLYKQEHLPDSKIISDYISSILTSMRKDIKAKVKTKNKEPKK